MKNLSYHEIFMTYAKEMGILYIFFKYYCKPSWAYAHAGVDVPMVERILRHKILQMIECYIY
jgi:hypothetical protein